MPEAAGSSSEQCQGISRRSTELRWLKEGRRRHPLAGHFCGKTPQHQPPEDPLHYVSGRGVRDR